MPVFFLEVLPIVEHTRIFIVRFRNAMERDDVLRVASARDISVQSGQ